MKPRRVAGAAALLGLPALSVVLIVVAGVVTLGGTGSGGDDQSTGAAAVGCVDRIAATIRTIESSGRYELPGGSGGASGAYQVIDSTWRAWARAAGVDPADYPSAYLAPPAVQDLVALHEITRFLSAGNPIGDLPVSWYWPRALTRPEDLDVVPMPEAGNSLTPRQYRERWLAELARRGGCAATPVAVSVPAGAPRGSSGSGGIGNTPEPELAGLANGQYPVEVLTLVDAGRCRANVRPGCYLAPRTAAAFVALRAAAASVGFDVRLTSAYRSADDQARIIRQSGLIGAGGLGAPIGDSPHGLGIAIDVDVAGEPGLSAWLAANAARWCMGNFLSAAVRGSEPWHWALDVGCTPRG